MQRSSDEQYKKESHKTDKNYSEGISYLSCTRRS